MLTTYYRGFRFEVNGREIKVKTPSGALIGKVKSYAAARRLVLQSTRVA